MYLTDSIFTQLTGIFGQKSRPYLTMSKLFLVDPPECKQFFAALGHLLPWRDRRPQCEIQLSPGVEAIRLQVWKHSRFRSLLCIHENSDCTRHRRKINCPKKTWLLRPLMNRKIYTDQRLEAEPSEKRRHDRLRSAPLINLLSVKVAYAIFDEESLDLLPPQGPNRKTSRSIYLRRCKKWNLATFDDPLHTTKISRPWEAIADLNLSKIVLASLRKDPQVKGRLSKVWQARRANMGLNRFLPDEVQDSLSFGT